MKTVFRGFLIASILLINMLSGCKENPVDNAIPTTPVVSLISPTSSSLLQDSVLVEVGATDDKGITKVEVYIDNQIPQGGTILVPPYKYTWDIRSFPDSSAHILYAKAYDADGNVSTTPVLTLVLFTFAPSNLSATVLPDTLIKLNWRDNSRKETAFEVEQALSDSTFVLVKLIPSNSTSADIRGAYKVGDKMTFRVRAIAGDQKSKYTNTVAVILTFPVPQLSSATFLSDTSARLIWLDNSSFETGFEIELARSAGAFKSIATTIPNVTSTVVIDTFYTGASYAFRVRAKSTYNVSAYSNQISTSLTFVAPSNLALSSVKANEIVLQWNDNTSFENGFSIERQEGAFPFREIRRVPANSVSAIDTLADTTLTYSYRVRAFTSLNSSTYSNTIRLGFIPLFAALPDLAGHSGVVGSVAFSPDGSLVASASYDATIKLWKTADGSLLRTLSGYSNQVNSVAFSPDGATLASSGMDGSIRLWHIPDGAPLRTLSLSIYYASDVAFSPSGAILATGGFYAILGGVKIDSNIVLWRPSDGGIIRTMRGDPQGIGSVAFSSDGSLLASGGANDVKLWLVSDGSLLRTLVGHTNSIWSVTFDPSGTIVASASRDSTIRLWSAADGSLVRTLTGYSGGVRSLAFSPSGLTLAAASDDKKVKLWRVSDGASLYTFTMTTGFPASVAFSLDGSMLAAGTSTSVIKWWRLKGQWQAVP